MTEEATTVSIPFAGIIVFLQRFFFFPYGCSRLFQSRLPGLLFFYVSLKHSVKSRVTGFNPVCRDFCFSTTGQIVVKGSNLSFQSRLPGFLFFYAIAARIVQKLHLAV